MGPATASEQMIVDLIAAGMDVARINFSHGEYHEHKQMIDIIRKAAARLQQPIAILQDLQGPKLRIGKVKNGSIQLEKGDSIAITIEDVLGDEHVISTTYKNLVRDVQPGAKILLDDGFVQLIVRDVQNDRVICEVLEGGALSDHKGINLPGVAISNPSFTGKDHADLLFGLEQGVDFVALSFVRCAEDIIQVKELIAESGKDIPVIAKIEKPEAVAKLDEIITVADGVMIARGDLGVELPLEKVPPLQKRIIRLALQKGRPVITATQMLESMRAHARPTRAEVSDVANAIFDGSDAVMLSAETSIGEYPVQTVQTMARIIEEAEQATNGLKLHQRRSLEHGLTIPDAISCAACEAAQQLEAGAIVAFTTSGFTARMVSKNRPGTPIIVFTFSDNVQRQLNLLWGVTPIKLDLLYSTDEIISQTEKVLLEKNIVEKGDIVVILMGAPIYTKGTTNLMKLHVIGESI